MVRRRGAFSFGRRGGQRKVPPMLPVAHQFLNKGRFAEAAKAFHQLARTAEERFPERAPILYLQAGRAAILDGQTQTGLGHLRHGLTLLAAQGRHARMQRLGQRAVQELTERGLQAEADEITGLLSANVPQENLSQTHAGKKPLLPTHCPSCGGALYPDEIEWLDEVTAECAYCGSPVRGNP